MRITHLALLLLVLFAGSATAQTKRVTDEHKERWEQKSPAERAELRKRFEELQQLTEEERRALRDRARRFEERKRELRDEVSGEDRERLDSLPAKERERALSEKVIEEGRERGRSIRRHLPPELVERMERADRHERRRLMEEFRRRNREEKSTDTLRGLAKRLELTREELRTLEELPDDLRLRKIVELKRRALEEELRRDGLPGELSEDQYRRMRRLPPDEFLRRMRPWMERHEGRERRQPRMPAPGRSRQEGGGPPWRRSDGPGLEGGPGSERGKKPRGPQQQNAGGRGRAL